MYDDVYAKIKKVNTSKGNDDKPHWNVLMIGMDSMSRVRAYHELPRTVEYLNEENWMDFKAYNKAS